MWPFNSLKEKLRKQDAMEKYRQWLKKWRLRGAKFTKFSRPALIGLAVLMVGALLFAKLYNPDPVQPTNNPTTPPAVEQQQTTTKQTTEEQSTNTEPVQEEAQAAEPQVDISQLAMPVNGQVLLGYNQPYYSDQFDDYRFNTGVLFATDESAPVTAALAGKVTAVELDETKGFVVTIDHGQGYQTHYQGLNTVQVSVNQQINQGDVLGANNTQLQFILTHNGIPIDPLN